MCRWGKQQVLSWCGRGGVPGLQRWKEEQCLAGGRYLD